MLNHIKYDLKFSNTGRKFSQNINFKPGLTVITGANESGKSLIIEMIEYSLFGSSALRGILSDYDQIDTDLTFTIKSQEYKVVRRGSRATLNGNLAVGTAAVNRKIIELLGFNLDVWHIACSAKQGELDKLTARMRPTERRRMVDEVIGLTQIEDTEHEIKTEGNGHKRAAEMLENKLVKPLPIEIPTDYEPSADLEVEHIQALQLQAEYVQLEKIKEPSRPEEPIKPDYSDDVEQHEQQRLEIEREKAGLEGDLRRVPDIAYDRSTIQRAISYYKQRERGPRTKYKADDLHNWEEAWDLLRGFGHIVVCPNCGTNFDPASATTHILPEEPPISYEIVKAELSKLANWLNFNDEIIESTDLSEQETKEQEYALTHESYREQLVSRLCSLPSLADRSLEDASRREYERLMGRFRIDSEAYDNNYRQFKESQERLREITKRLASCGDLTERLKNSRLYEEQKRRYDVDVETYDKAVAEIEAERKLAEDFFKGVEALKEVRSKVKQHLIPSLNRVSSYLLSEMTDGERTKIEVDEEFEVKVDNQHVRTLSGSGASVVNLALRIALGQVLTQSMVPMFLADEIDKDMDSDREAATHKSLRNLTKILDKVIVVSHKQMQGDNIIAL